MSATGRYPTLPGTRVEIVSSPPRGRIEHVLLDFDGTLSLLRDGWQNVMVPLAVEFLERCPEAESTPALEAKAIDFIDHLTGKQTIYQMIRLAEEVHRRGGKPLDPLEYKRLYHERLAPSVAARIAAVVSAELSLESVLVPGARRFLEQVRDRGARLYLASGTDIEYVRREAEVLHLDVYFDGGIFGALPAYKDFSKAMVIENILAENDLGGTSLLVVGDGYVEIENARSAGAVALGIASRERNRFEMNADKRGRLIRAGAHLLAEDFRESAAIVEYLWR